MILRACAIALIFIQSAASAEPVFDVHVHLRDYEISDGFFADNINFDISGTVWLAADSPIEQEFIWTLRNVGVDHVLMGSDYPQMSLGKMVDALNRLGLTADETRKILSGNARKLLGK